jgi:hypothetical protein
MMKQALYYDEHSWGWKHAIYNNVPVGDMTNISGNLDGLLGDLTKISGDLTQLEGEVCPLLLGNLTGVFGRLDGMWGNVDDCELTDEERSAGVNIADLVQADRMVPS